MSKRIKQVKNLKTAEDFRAHIDSLGIELPFSDSVRADGSLASPVSIADSAGTLRSPNGFAILPMEGWDGTDAGAPTDLVRRRWERFGTSGAGLVWAEATAVVPEGRANPHQLVLNEQNAADFADLRKLLDPSQVVGLQLTHSGRYCRPEGAPAPRTAYEHPLLDGPSGASAESLMTDDELDQLADTFIAAAGLAHRAGFQFVDVKACHGYLGHELLSAFDRPGRYGGDFEGRTRFFRTVVEGIRSAVPELAIALRLSIFDLMPHHPGTDGAGEPASTEPYRHAFGGDGTGLGYDLAETHQLLELAESLGISLISATAGSPYYCPHQQRPAYFPPSDGYTPPEDPLVGVARLLAATAELTAAHPDMVIVGSGYSYLQDWLPNVGQAVLDAGGATMIGIGRMALSYPDLPAAVLGSEILDRQLICRTFSDCTTAPRAGLVSGCFPLDPFYKAHDQRVELTQAKKAARARLKG